MVVAGDHHSPTKTFETMLDEFYQEQERRRNRLDPVIKVLLILAILFGVYCMYPVAKACYLIVKSNQKGN